MEEVLERARQVAEEAEVFSITQRGTPVVFEANRLKLLESRETSGTALRIIKDGRLGFSSTTDQGDREGLVHRALEMTPFGAAARFHFPSSQQMPPVEVHDPQVESCSQEQMIHLGQGLIDRVRASHPDVQCEARVTKAEVTVRIINSQGAEVHYAKTVFGVFVEGARIRGEDMLFVGEGEGSCHPIEDTTAIGDSVLKQLDMARELAPPPLGEVPVIFTPHGVAGALLGPLLSAFNGRTVLQGASPLEGKLGQPMLDPRFTLVDDPTVDFAPGSRICDDEGVPSRPTSLVEGGAIAHFLYDLQTAGQAGTESTGSASRSLGSQPAPSTSVILVRPGEVSLQDMLDDMKVGLIVEGLLGAGQGNVLGGDFSANVLLGYRVESGRVVGRVKNTMIHGNVYRVLRDIAAIGKETRWVGGSMHLPHLYCRGVAVSAKG